MSVVTYSWTGHLQQEHDTRHGSISKAQWVIDGLEGTAVEFNGRRFGVGDTDAPAMCSLYCSEMGRHAHIDYCRATSEPQTHDPETEHIQTLLKPNPNRPKDWISHRLYWLRTGK
jgi:hypothetical protein